MLCDDCSHVCGATPVAILVQDLDCREALSLPLAPSSNLQPMANKNAFLAVRLDDTLIESLSTAAQALATSPSDLLSMPEGTTFNPVERVSLHMTFVFFGEHLRALPGKELRALYEELCNVVADGVSVDDGLKSPLRFLGFDLFPPGKQNLVVARFAPTKSLLSLRDTVLDACKKHAVSLPTSLFQQLEGEGTWSPHVTLGKIQASRAIIGNASCTGSGIQALAPTTSFQPCGLTLLGEPPPRVWFDWTEPFTFNESELDG